MFATTQMRVRQVLGSLGAAGRAELKALLPAKLVMPEDATLAYPGAVLNCFPKAESYSFLGLAAEELLRAPHAEITLAELFRVVRKWAPEVTLGHLQKIRASVQTAPFLEALVETRKKVEAVARPPLRFDEVVAHGAVQGHPDARTETQMLEVKLTGQLKQNWTDFLFQVFAYGALAPEVTDVYLVLPLQKTVWHCDIRGWEKRGAYRDFLCAAAARAQSNAVNDMMLGAAIRAMYRIGSHVKKQKTLEDTVRGLPDYSRPWQIFLGGAQNSKIAVKDADIATTAAMVAATGAQLYVHSQYIINLCAKAEDDWGTKLLIRNVQIARAAGCRGVVVHVGKSTTQPLEVAMATMRAALGAAMEHASPECPVLLETPAGQGTETLKKQEEFLTFLESFGGDPRLRACLDTCHVFACGHTPLEFLGRLAERPGLLKLVHYNDSAAACGSCVDRHAFMGTGHIGMEGMRQIAEFCAAREVPMLIE